MRLPKHASKSIIWMGLIAIAIFFFMLKQLGLDFGGVSGVARTVFYGLLFAIGFFWIMKTIFRV